MSSTRLQKLLKLLESNNSSNRRAAAVQICDVAKAHQQQLVYIIRKVHGYLYSKSWDTRVAAAETLGLLAQAFPHHSVADLSATADAAGQGQQGPTGVPVLLERLDLQQVLQKGTPLVASGGQEYDLVDEDLTPAERLAKQRAQLKKRLGLDQVLDKMFDTNELIEDADFAADPSSRAGGASAHGAPAAQLVGSMAGVHALERSRQKRKRGKGAAVEQEPALQGKAACAAAGNGASSSSQQPSTQPEQQAMEQDQEEWWAIEAGAWPFQRLCDLLLVDILDPRWEVRHGAAAGLREVLRHQAAAAGIEAVPVDPDSSWEAGWQQPRALQRSLTGAEVAAAAAGNQEWLGECATLLLCVLALDQYADYSSDQVVVPVRETCAQALGAVLQPLNLPCLQCVLQQLTKLYRWGTGQKQWHVRHAAFTGLKYLLVTRRDAAQQLLPEAAPALLQGLQDGEDSVQAVAADALVLMVPLLQQLQLVPAELADILWNMLDDMEELSAATSSSLALLAALYAQPPTLTSNSDASPGGMVGLGGGSATYSRCLPLLWPFLNHALSSVRLASLSCLRQLLVAAFERESAAGQVDEVPGPLLGSCLKLLFQTLLTEPEPQLQAKALAAWEAVVTAAGADRLAAALCEQDVRTMLTLAATPAKRPLDTRLLLVAEGRELVSMAEALDTGLVARPAKRQRTEGGSSGLGEEGGVGAAVTAYDPEQPVGGGSQQQVLALRRVAAQALGCLCHRLQLQVPPMMPPLLQQQLDSNCASSRLLAGLTLCCWVLRLRQDLAAAAPQEQQQQRQAAAAAAAGGSSVWQQPPAAQVASQVVQHIPSTLLQRCLECCAAPSAARPSPPSLDPYAELKGVHAVLHRQLVALLSACLEAGWRISTPENLPVDKVCATGALNMLATIPPAAEGVGQVAALKAQVTATASELQVVEAYLHVCTLSCLAAALAHAGQLPAKLNLIIPNLMVVLRKDTTGELQQVAAAALAELVLCCVERQSVTNPKVIKNLVTMACSDPLDTPAADLATMPDEAAALAERRSSHAAASSSHAPVPLRSTTSIGGSGDMALGVSQTLAAAGTPTGNADATPAIARRGAELALVASCQRMGPRLRELLPLIWEAMTGAVVAAGTALGMPPEPGPVAPTAAAPAGTAEPGGAQPTVKLEAGSGSAAVKTEAGDATGPAAAVQTEAAAAVKAEPVVNTEAGGPADAAAAADPASIISALQLIKVMLPALHPQLQPQALQLLPCVVGCLQHANAGVRLAAARCLAVVAAADPGAVMPLTLRRLLPLLDGSQPTTTRLGAAEATAQLERHLGADLVPYVVLLLVPLLRRMSDPCAEVRARTAACFGALTSLLPLAQGLPLPGGLNAGQAAQCLRDQQFLEQLLDNRKVELCELPVPLHVTLRHYQHEGISWLAFLHKFGLHGCLADDMGLGKTLQATTILACSMAQQRAAAAAGQTASTASPTKGTPAAAAGSATTAAAAAAAAGSIPLPSLVVCPSTLVAHWAHEIEKYVAPEVLRPLLVLGSPSERAAAQKKLPAHDVAIMSYDALRSDADWATNQCWDYVILDEGHVIRNTKSKLSQAVKKLQAQHRLVLSGTPIQNSALELWSLFDFLMPGLLGDERSFQARFGRTVAAGRYSRKGSKERDASLLALDALHKQVMPFVLRRTKQQVLSDLPPKVITDIICELSPLQRQLYEDFASSSALSQVAGALATAAAASGGEGGGSGAAGGGKGRGHVFPALLYLRRLCSHPLLALDWQVPEHVAAVKRVLHVGTQAAATPLLHALDQSPKLLALQDIFVQCGLVEEGATAGKSSSSKQEEGEEVLAGGGGGDSGHRLLVFAQLKGTLDLVEKVLLEPLGVSYLRLDGGVEAAARFGLVQQFNSDPTIQVLLLTTHVGGLGLNLTSADTVVFLEHDWNPMKDLQAMDRAHRLGQTRCVNVYRLLMKDTLEERIMGLQQFKLDVANAVVNQDNVSMSSMDTGALLELFGAPGAGDSSKAGQGTNGAVAKKKGALAQILEGMGDLWDGSQYDEQFDVHSFLQKLGK